MKLIYLHQYFKFPNEAGGTRSYDLATSFVNKGYEVVVITATSDQNYKTNNHWYVEKREGLEIHWIFLPYGNDLSYIKRSLVFFKFLWFSSFHLLKIRADFVLATSTPLTIGIPALIKKWLHKTPFVFEVRDVWPEAVIAIGAVKNKWLQKILYGLEKLVYKNAAAIVPLSTDMQKSIISRYLEFAEKTSVVIENISEINRFQGISEKINLKEIVGFEPRFSVLYAGTFGKVNGIHKIIELAEKTLLLDEGIVYILIGEGAEKEKVKQLAIDKEVLNKNVYILNPVSKAQLPLWYNSISVGASFVIDTKELWANSANKFFDTLAASKPLLINHEGWQAETIRYRNVGYVLPFEVTDKAVQNFVEYTHDEEFIDEQKKQALMLAKEKYTLEKATESYLKVFRKINK